MCFGGGGQSAPAIPPAPPPPPTPPPTVAAPIATPEVPTAPQRAETEAARLKPPGAELETKRRLRKGTAQLKSTPGQEISGSSLSYGGEVGSSGMSLNIQRPQ